MAGRVNAEAEQAFRQALLQDAIVQPDKHEDVSSIIDALSWDFPTIDTTRLERLVAAPGPGKIHPKVLLNLINFIGDKSGTTVQLASRIIASWGVKVLAERMVSSAAGEPGEDDAQAAESLGSHTFWSGVDGQDVLYRSGLVEEQKETPLFSVTSEPCDTATVHAVDEAPASGVVDGSDEEYAAFDEVSDDEEEWWAVDDAAADGAGAEVSHPVMAGPSARVRLLALARLLFRYGYCVAGRESAQERAQAWRELALGKFLMRIVKEQSLREFQVLAVEMLVDRLEDDPAASTRAIGSLLNAINATGPDVAFAVAMGRLARSQHTVVLEQVARHALASVSIILQDLEACVDLVGVQNVSKVWSWQALNGVLCVAAAHAPAGAASERALMPLFDEYCTYLEQVAKSTGYIMCGEGSGTGASDDFVTIACRRFPPLRERLLQRSALCDELTSADSPVAQVRPAWQLTLCALLTESKQCTSYAANAVAQRAAAWPAAGAELRHAVEGLYRNVTQGNVPLDAGMRQPLGALRTTLTEEMSEVAQQQVQIVGEEDEPAAEVVPAPGQQSVSSEVDPVAEKQRTLRVAILKLLKLLLSERAVGKTD